MAQHKARKKSDLTPKQRKFMKAVLVDGKNRTQAADEVYDCKDRKSAQVVGSVTWKSIESVLEQEYDKYGLSKELILTALVEDIKNNPGKRERLLDMGGKFLGMGVERKTIEHTGKGIESLFGEIDDTKRISD
jgi:hypothetical protein